MVPPNGIIHYSNIPLRLYPFPDADFTYNIVIATAKGIMTGKIDTPGTSPRIVSTTYLTSGK